MAHTSYVPMGREEQVAFLATVDRTNHLVQAADKWLAYVMDPPMPGSPMAYAYTQQEREAFDFGYSLLYAVQDHLRAFSAVTKPVDGTSSIPSYALFTLLRSAAEATVRARHLLDPAINHEERLGRALNERLTNLIEHGKVVLNPPRVAARTAHLAKRATSLGIPVRYDKNGKVFSFGQPRQTMLDLFAKYVRDGAQGWRELSAYAHSMQWMITHVSRAIPSANPGVMLVPTDANTAQLLKIMTGVLDVFDDTSMYWVVLAGIPADVWKLARQ
jgi:hypothetical protein